MKKMCRCLLVAVLCISMVLTFMPAVAYGEPDSGAVHVYDPTGDDPATGTNESPDVVSDKYNVTVNGTAVPAIQYIAMGHEMDIARFASSSRTPGVVVEMKDSTTINTVQVYPERYYPQSALTISMDKKTVTFNMSEKLGYAIVYVNGTPANGSGKPYLTIVNDPMEDTAAKPKSSDSNVLDFKAFSDAYLLAHPITDKVGDKCVDGATIQDTSKNTSEVFTWTHDTGYRVAYDSNSVQFPNLRVRQPNDVSDAFQAALEEVKNDPDLDTIYFPAGTYLWSGLRIENWNGDVSKGGKPLTIYTDEGALLKNRLQECREAMEPAIWISESSYVTVSGRGMHDGQGVTMFNKDRKDARITPHQGGSMVLHSNNIEFNDTYVRDVKQWNWECHTVTDVTYNNIKGLSPYNHAWVDGLDLTSGVNVTVNGAITLGNDDTFATGHYNPSNEFPVRIFNENRTDEQTGNIMSAAYYYNGSRLNWDTEDSENITINDSLGWTIDAGNGMRFGHSTQGHQLKSYTFNNFNAIGFGGSRYGVTVQNNTGTYPSYDSVVFKNCSFDMSKGGTNFQIRGLAGDKIANVELTNCWFSGTLPSNIQNANNVLIKDLYIGGKLVRYLNQSNFTPGNIDNLTFMAGENPVLPNTLPIFSAMASNYDVYANNPLNFTVKATDADAGDSVTLAVEEGTLPDGAAFNAGTGVFSWKPASSDIDKNYTVVFYAFDAGARDEAYPPVEKSVVISVLSPAFEPITTLTTADAHVQSYGSEKGTRYGNANSLKMRLINTSGTYGPLGELFHNTSTSDTADGKIAYMTFDLSTFLPEKDAFDRGSRANLILTYQGHRNNTTRSDTSIRVAPLNSDVTFSESTGSTGVNWNSHLGVDTTLIKESEMFDLGTVTGANPSTNSIDGRKVKVDVTEFVKVALDAGRTAISFAVSDRYGQEIWFVSKEGARTGSGRVDMTPTLTMGVDIAVAIDGPTSMSLTGGYGASSSDSFVIKGGPDPVSVIKVSGNDKITWNNATYKLDIAAGLHQGVYPVLLEAENGNGVKAEHTFTLSVSADSTELQNRFDEISDEGLLPGAYTSSSWDALVDAMEYAVEVLGEPDPAQDDVDAALALLNEARGKLAIRAGIGMLASLQWVIDWYEATFPEADYTPNSWKPLGEALDAAKAIIATPSGYSDQDIIDAMDVIVDAEAGLVYIANKSDLKFVIDYADNMLKPENIGKYHPASVANLQIVFTSAGAVYADGDATQAEVDQAQKDLVSAIGQMYELGDKTGLRALYTLVSRYTAGSYTPASWATFANALTAAQAVLNDPNAIKDSVEAAYTALANATAGLTRKANLAGLNAAIAVAQEMVDKITDYTPSTVVGLADLLSSTKSVAADLNVTQETVNAATAALNAKILDARLKPDLSGLLSATNRAKALNAASYTADSCKPLSTAIAGAEAVLAAPDEVTQDDVSNATHAVNSAIAGLVPRAGVTVAGENGKITAPVASTVIPKAKILKITASTKAKIVVKWVKAPSVAKVTGYQVQYRVKGTSRWKTKTVLAKSASLTLKSLKKNKQYQFRVRAYRNNSGAKEYGAWSGVKISKRVK